MASGASNGCNTVVTTGAIDIDVDDVEDIDACRRSRLDDALTPTSAIVAPNEPRSASAVRAETRRRSQSHHDQTTTTQHTVLVQSRCIVVDGRVDERERASCERGDRRRVARRKQNRAESQLSR
jgi:hypothetical protein